MGKYVPMANDGTEKVVAKETQTRNVSTCYNCKSESHRLMDCGEPITRIFCFRCGKCTKLHLWSKKLEKRRMLDHRAMRPTATNQYRITRPTTNQRSFPMVDPSRLQPAIPSKIPMNKINVSSLSKSYSNQRENSIQSTITSEIIRSPVTQVDRNTEIPSNEAQFDHHGDENKQIAEATVAARLSNPEITEKIAKNRIQAKDNEMSGNNSGFASSLNEVMLMQFSEDEDENHNTMSAHAEPPLEKRIKKLEPIPRKFYRVMSAIVNDERPYAIVKIYEIETRGLLDSGAQASIVNEKLSTELMARGLKLRECDIFVTTADGSCHKVLGYMNIPFNLNGVRRIIATLVVRQAN